MFKDNARSTYTVQPPLAWLKKAVLVASIAGFAGIIWYVAAQRDSLSSETVEPELVRAPKVAIKERPDTPGGMEVPHQDKQVFNLLDGGAEAQPVAPEAAQIAPPVTEPKAPVAEQAPTKAAEPVKEAPKPLAPVAAAPAPAPKPAPTTVVATASGWAVQLGSFRSEEDAQKGINIIQGKYKGMLDGLKPYIQRADLAKGTFYRVMFVGLENKTAASNLCAAFKQRGQGCLHVKL